MIPMALIAIACWAWTIAKAVGELFVNISDGALGSRMNANQMIRETAIPSMAVVAFARPMTHRRKMAPMIEMTSAATKPGAGLPVCVIPRAFSQRRPNKGGENQIPPMIQALSPASTIAIQLKLDVSKDTMVSPRPGRSRILKYVTVRSTRTVSPERHTFREGANPRSHDDRPPRDDHGRREDRTPRRDADHDRELSKTRREGILQQHDLPPRDPGLHDPRRRPAGHGPRRARVHHQGRTPSEQPKCSRHDLDGERRSEHGREPVLHQRGRQQPPRQQASRLRPGRGRHGSRRRDQPDSDGPRGSSEDEGHDPEGEPSPLTWTVRPP